MTPAGKRTAGEQLPVSTHTRSLPVALASSESAPCSPAPLLASCDTPKDRAMGPSQAPEKDAGQSSKRRTKPPPAKEDHGGWNCQENLPGADAVPDPFTHQKGHTVENSPTDIGHHADGVFPVHRPGLPVPKPAQGRGQFPIVFPQFHRPILRLIHAAPGRLFRAFPQG